MKKIFFCSALIAFIGCNSVENIHASDVEKWKLKNRVATRMMKRDHKCGFLKPCEPDNTIIVNPNSAVKDALSDKYTLTPRYARYIKINRRDYRILRNLPDSESEVKGYKTTIYEAVPKAGSLSAAKTYYDIVTICPPPRPCARKEPLNK